MRPARRTSPKLCSSLRSQIWLADVAIMLRDELRDLGCPKSFRERFDRVFLGTGEDVALENAERCQREVLISNRGERTRRKERTLRIVVGCKLAGPGKLVDEAACFFLVVIFVLASRRLRPRSRDPHRAEEER